MTTGIRAFDNARELVESIDGLPTLPNVVCELIERTGDPNTTVGHITAIIENDPALNARILKLVNSAFYGLPRRITSLHAAVSILGFNAIRNVVLAASIFNLFSKRRIGFDTAGFWTHCLAAGVCCSVIARRRGDEGSEFVYGLLHDLGKIVLAAHFDDITAKVLRLTRERRMAFHEAEQEIMGFDHAHIGAALAENWRFPRELVRAIRYHHHVDVAGDTAADAAIVHVSDCIVRALQLGWCGDDVVPALSDAALRALNLADADLAPIMEGVSAGLASAGEFVDLIHAGQPS